MSSNASFQGIGRGYEKPAKQPGGCIPLARIYRGQEVKVTDLDDLISQLNSEDFCLLEVVMNNVSDVYPEECAIVTYESISDEATGRSIPAVTILTSGDVFSLSRIPVPNSEVYRQKAHSAGRKVYRRFLNLVDLLRPAYGAISVEWPLESPPDLAKDPRSKALRNLYISKSHFDSRTIVKIRSLYAQAYIEELEGGLYASTMREFNPKGVEVDFGDSGTEVARLISRLIP